MWVATFWFQPCGEFCGWGCPCAVNLSTTIWPNSEFSRVYAYVLPSLPVKSPTAYARAGALLSVREATWQKTSHGTRQIEPPGLIDPHFGSLMRHCRIEEMNIVEVAIKVLEVRERHVDPLVRRLVALAQAQHRARIIAQDGARVPDDEHRARWLGLSVGQLDDAVRPVMLDRTQTHLVETPTVP
jgi:PIN domain nuclease of toxin-antitoxin system